MLSILQLFYLCISLYVLFVATGVYFNAKQCDILREKFKFSKVDFEIYINLQILPLILSLSHFITKCRHRAVPVRVPLSDKFASRITDI